MVSTQNDCMLNEDCFNANGENTVCAKAHTGASNIVKILL